MSIAIAAPLGEVPTAPAKLRILETADALFYVEGIRAIGVDRLIAEARVTKATFYKHFGSKDRLAAAYVEHRHRRLAAAISAIAADADDPADGLLALRDLTLADLASPGFRGCPFVNAAAEFCEPTHPVRLAVAAHREWMADALESFTRAVGHPLAGDAADDLALARDGALSGGYAGDAIAAAGALTRAFDRVLVDAGARALTH